MVGVEVIVSLEQKIKEYQNSNRLTILKAHKLEKMIIQDNEIKQVLLTSKEGEKILETNNLVLATGGFAANREMVAEYRPDLVHLPTTNGYHATGDAHGMLKG